MNKKIITAIFGLLLIVQATAVYAWFWIPLCLVGGILFETTGCSSCSSSAAAGGTTGAPPQNNAGEACTAACQMSQPHNMLECEATCAERQATFARCSLQNNISE